MYIRKTIVITRVLALALCATQIAAQSASAFRTLADSHAPGQSSANSKLAQGPGAALSCATVPPARSAPWTFLSRSTILQRLISILHLPKVFLRAPLFRKKHFEMCAV